MNRFRHTALVLAFFLAAFTPLFSAGYNISIRIDGIQDTTLLLAYHFGNRKYIKDTIRVDSRGAGIFSGEEALPGGIYLVVMPEMNYFELLIDKEQEFVVETNTEDPVRNMTIRGSAENEQFIKYHKFMGDMQTLSSRLQERMENNRQNPDSMQYLQSEAKTLDSKVQEYWKSIVADNPGTLLANMINAMQNPKIPDFDIPASAKNPDSLKWAKGYEYNKQHYFDLIDFSDDRLLRTPVLHSKLEHFFSRVLIQQPDAIIPEAVRIIELSKANQQVFQYVVVYLLNHYERSHIMGLDEVFVELAERYYLTGEAFWADEETVSKLRERVERLKPNLIGRTAAELKMRTPLGATVSLHDIIADYTIVYFYEPGCGHCKVVTPRLNELNIKYKDRVKVFGVYILGDTKEWTDYIDSNNLDWINVYDPQNTSYFRHYYDVYSTPTIYILDSKKTIIAKRLGIETVEQMLEELM
jgi:thiol-disulfide isomerase/thioredoxin